MDSPEMHPNRSYLNQRSFQIMAMWVQTVAVLVILLVSFRILLKDHHFFLVDIIWIHTPSCLPSILIATAMIIVYYRMYSHSVVFSQKNFMTDTGAMPN